MSDPVMSGRPECYLTGRVVAQNRASPDPTAEDRLQRLLGEDPNGLAGVHRRLHAGAARAHRAAGIVDGDETMEVYVRACERLAARNDAALTRREPSIGSLTGWLAVIARRRAHRTRRQP